MDFKKCGFIDCTEPSIEVLNLEVEGVYNFRSAVCKTHLIFLIKTKIEDVFKLQQEGKINGEMAVS